MALWLKPDGTMKCAAHFSAEDGDIYIDDRHHHRLVALDKIETIGGELWRWKKEAKPMTKKGQPQYHLECDKCGDLFWSEEGFPDPCWCPECKANPVRSKSVKARLKAQKPQPQGGLTEELKKVRESVVHLATGLLIICGELKSVDNLSDEDKGRFEGICQLTLKNITQIFKGYLSPQEVKEQVKQARREIGEWLESRMFAVPLRGMEWHIKLDDVEALKSGELPLALKGGT